jgi:Zn-dependent metalloprotease
MLLRRRHLGHVPPLLLLASACALPACGAADSPPLDLAARLEADTGAGWTVYTDPTSRSVRFLAPARPVFVGRGSPEADARAFFARYAEELSATGRPDELRTLTVEPELGGGTYVRLEHVLPSTGLRVFDVASIAHFRADGALYMAKPGFRAGLLDVPRKASVPRERAVQAAQAHVGASCGAAPASPSETPELGVAAVEGAPLALAYRISFRETGASCLAPDVDVDATTGEVLAMHERGSRLEDDSRGVRSYALNEPGDHKKIDVTATWHLVGPTTYTLTSTASPRVITRQMAPSGEVDFTSTTLGAWDATYPAGQGAAVDAHYHVGKALRYFHEVHRLRGLDGKGADLVVVVHDNVHNLFGMNAHYDAGAVLPWAHGWGFPATIVGDHIRVGDGNGILGGDWMPLSAAFDVMAHEVAHGVVNHTSRLVYESESGALNESFADVMGATAERWFDGQFAPRRDRKNNLVIGEQFTRSGRGLRDLEDPRRLGQPGHMSQRISCTWKEVPGAVNDQCWVHANSGIPNRAFSLMTLGGTHKDSMISVPVGIGWEKARELWYETMTRLQPQDGFATAALAQLTWAAEHQPESLTAVGCAWLAVGVLAADLSPVVATLACGSGAPKGVTATGPCVGRSSGWICDPGAPSSALSCNGAATTPSVSCADPDQRCKPASSADPSATVAPDGTLLCE